MVHLSQIGGNLTDNPVAIQYGTQLEGLGREANGQTYSDVYTPGRVWTGWNSIGGNLLPYPTLLTPGPAHPVDSTPAPYYFTSFLCPPLPSL